MLYLNTFDCCLKRALRGETPKRLADVRDGFNCFRSNVEVRLGEHDIWEPEGTEQHIMSAKFISHPDYNSRTQDNDIMLIKLSRPANLNDFVRPAALPSKCATVGTMCQISGWGNLRPSDQGCELHAGPLNSFPNLFFSCYKCMLSRWRLFSFCLFQRGTLISCSALRPLS